MSGKKPCEQCPWRLVNQSKRHPFHFYTKANLSRLWNQIRKGGGMQSCHLTDPSHPDHVAVGAKPGATAQECPGSVILVRREAMKMADDKGLIDVEGLTRYKLSRKKGLTKTGILYWIVQRIQFAGQPFVGGEALPEVDDEDVEIGLPENLREG